MITDQDTSSSRHPTSGAPLSTKRLVELLGILPSSIEDPAGTSPFDLDAFPADDDSKSMCELVYVSMENSRGIVPDLRPLRLAQRAKLSGATDSSGSMSGGTNSQRQAICELMEMKSLKLSYLDDSDSARLLLFIRSQTALSLQQLQLSGDSWASRKAHRILQALMARGEYQYICITQPEEPFNVERIREEQVASFIQLLAKVQPHCSIVIHTHCLSAYESKHKKTNSLYIIYQPLFPSRPASESETELTRNLTDLFNWYQASKITILRIPSLNLSGDPGKEERSKRTFSKAVRNIKENFVRKGALTNEDAGAWVFANAEGCQMQVRMLVENDDSVASCVVCGSMEVWTGEEEGANDEASERRGGLEGREKRHRSDSSDSKKNIKIACR